MGVVSVKRKASVSAPTLDSLSLQPGGCWIENWGSEVCENTSSVPRSVYTTGTSAVSMDRRIAEVPRFHPTATTVPMTKAMYGT